MEVSAVELADLVTGSDRMRSKAIEVMANIKESYSAEVGELKKRIAERESDIENLGKAIGLLEGRRHRDNN